MKQFKNILALAIVLQLAAIILLVAFDIGQQRVDDWEECTGRYGDGLR